MTQSSENMLAELQDRARGSLERIRGQMQGRLRGLSDLIVDKPIRSLGVAFLSGFVIARLLQKLG